METHGRHVGVFSNGDHRGGGKFIGSSITTTFQQCCTLLLQFSLDCYETRPKHNIGNLLGILHSSTFRIYCTHLPCSYHSYPLAIPVTPSPPPSPLSHSCLLPPRKEMEKPHAYDMNHKPTWQDTYNSTAPTVLTYKGVISSLQDCMVIVLGIADLQRLCANSGYESDFHFFRNQMRKAGLINSFTHSSTYCTMLLKNWLSFRLCAVFRLYMCIAIYIGGKDHRGYFYQSCAKT